jgi:HD superfamily phosphohydrolase
MVSRSEADLGFYYDGIYGYIPIRPILRDALNLKTMQRLRRLRQLATLELFFPGATHTRFAHSVGVFFIATRILEHLMDMQDDPETRVDCPPINTIHQVATQLAALFHDVGHGPFSHLFEMYVTRNRAYRKWVHESVSEELITKGIGEFSDLPLFLNKLKESFESRGVPGDPNFLKPENIAAISQGRPPPAAPEYHFLSQILKCPFDADRMDYLRRDAYYTGVETGRVDIWELVNNTTIGKEKPVSDDATFHLRIDKRAAVSLEAFLLARDLMYRRVYYNKAHRGHQELIIRAFSEMMEKHRPEELVMKTDDEMIDLFAHHNAFTKNVAERLTQRKLYEPLPFDINVFANLDEHAQSRWASLRAVARNDVLDTEKRLNQKLALRAGETIILDIEQIPLTKKEDYQGKYLLDRETGESLSLLETLPHMALTRGTVQDVTGKIVDLGLTYLNMLTNFSAFAPPELCVEFAMTIKNRLGPSATLEDITKVIEMEVDTSNCPLKVVFDEFATLLGLSGDAKDTLWSRSLGPIRRYIEGLIRD